MAARSRVQVVIYGRTYQLAGADPEHTRLLARKVDETMTRFSDATPGAENYQLAILTALHLADELSAVNTDFEDYRSRVGDSADRILESVESGMSGDESESEGGEGTEEHAAAGETAAPESD